MFSVSERQNKKSLLDTYLSYISLSADRVFNSTAMEEKKTV